MVNAQQEINQRYPNKNTDKIDIRNIHLEGNINLSEYTNLRDIHLVSCGLNDYSFLDTVPHKEKLTILDLGGDNSASNHKFQELLWKTIQFVNLEWVSLDGIKASNDEINLKPWGFLPKCHTFAVNNNLVMGWEYSLDTLQRAYWDEGKNQEFLRWKKTYQLARKLARWDIEREKAKDNQFKSQISEKNQWISRQQNDYEQLKREKEQEKSAKEEKNKKIIESEKTISSLKKENTDLNNRISNLEEELEIERSNNLEMLENLKTLNERKYQERLEIALKEKTQRIEFLERILLETSSNSKINELETKMKQLEAKFEFPPKS
ncbi:MAG: Chromosome partition protein Smc [Mycoplasmataceae bacterium]|nr:MAG: Chromosome partition protein Smc [Mycoplasmataceae bacterium]